jgi:formate hydrogenlyase subunit 3/multisubunit Na+/H+ antiporter MnhD subunit
VTVSGTQLVEGGLLAQPVLAAVAVAAAVALPGAARRVVTGGAGVLLGAAGVIAGAAAWSGASGAVAVRTALPGITLAYAPDRLGGAFAVLTGAVTVLAACWAAGDRHDPGRTAAAAFPVFALGLLWVTAAADVVALLAAWEVMAVASTVLVLTDHARRPAVTGAGVWYAAMTHLSFVLVLGGFAVLAAAAGGTGFAQLARLDPRQGAVSAGVVLLLLGFATKAGAVPLHVWLPRAHPEAPSHASALLSAGMVKAGVYGMLLVLVRLVPGGPQWWGLLVLALGAASAVFGILQASVAADLKRLLAYSTTENAGLILAAIGAAQLTAARGEAGTAGVLLVAALLLTFSHAAAKSALFLTAGAVLHGAGTTDLDRLGGLARSMPWTCMAFGLAAFSAAGLPPAAGFAAEWALLQALVLGGQPADPWLAVMTAVIVGVVALTAGLALMTFTKAFGIAFLGRPRTPGAAAAREAPVVQRWAAGLAALAVLALGLIPGPLAGASAAALGGQPGVSRAGTAGAGMRLGALGAAGQPGATGAGVPAPVLEPLVLAGLGVTLAVVLAVLVLVLRARAPRRAVELGWGCGGARVSPRMQYTATSYAEPLVRVFDGVLGVARSIDSRPAPGPYLVAEIRFRQWLLDAVEERVYRPLLTAAVRVADAARGLQNGSVHRYLAWSFSAFVVVLLAASR